MLGSHQSFQTGAENYRQTAGSCRKLQTVSCRKLQAVTENASCRKLQTVAENCRQLQTKLQTVAGKLQTVAENCRLLQTNCRQFTDSKILMVAKLQTTKWLLHICMQV